MMPSHGTFRIITVDNARPAIVCLLCNRTSHSVEDVKQRYCGNCHLFHDVVMEARAYHAVGMTHDCSEWRTALWRCAVCGKDLRQAEQLAPGVYVTADGALHLDVAEMLKANGYADTPENRERLTRAAHEVFRRANPDVTIEDV